MELSPSDELVEYLAKQSTNTWDMMSEAEQKQVIQEIDEKLTAEYQKITDKFFSALNQSNFYSIIDQFAHDIFVGMGLPSLSRFQTTTVSPGFRDLSI